MQIDLSYGWKDSDVHALTKLVENARRCGRLGLASNQTTKTYLEKVKRLGHAWIAFSDEEIAGFAAYYANDLASATAFITIVVVDEKYQRQGIATRLVAALLGDVTRNGFGRCDLKVHFKNCAALKLYESYRFQVVNQEGEYLHMSREIKR